MVVSQEVQLPEVPEQETHGEMHVNVNGVEMHREEVPFYWKPDPQGHFMFWESKTRPVPLPQEEQFVEIPLQVAHL